MLCRVGATANGATVSLNRLTSSGTETMVTHPYLELTHLDRLLTQEDGIFEHKRASTTDDYPLVHSSTDHVAIFPDVATIPSELLYLHAATANGGRVNVRQACAGDV